MVEEYQVNVIIVNTQTILIWLYNIVIKDWLYIFVLRKYWFNTTVFRLCSQGIGQTSIVSSENCKLSYLLDQANATKKILEMYHFKKIIAIPYTVMSALRF